ncbi:MAG: acylphosphatase [Rhizobiales bacterium]|nr:acylphosphatase [Hyphomicrobiales bacterium]
MAGPALRLLIEGRVQGVGYRQWFAEEARSLGLTGWVRNRADGRVEAVISGKAELLERLVAAAERGPRFAAVSRIERHRANDEGWSDFSIQPTA